MCNEEHNREELQIAQLLCSTVRLLTADIMARLARMAGMFSAAEEYHEPGADGGGAEWTV